MSMYGFLAGLLTGLAAVALLAPWLRRMSWPSSIAASRTRAVVSAVILAALAFGAYRLQPVTVPVTASTAAPGSAARSFTAAARLLDKATAVPAATASGISAGPMTGTTGPATAAAGSMESAIGSLEARLAKGGGSPDDWELLAKSFEFLGRPADAARARAHQLPKAGGTPTPPGTSAGLSVSGEVTLADGLSSKARAGETLFIVAKSVDSPGIPVAVFRGSVASWPVRFTLDDSQSMMPGRTLSTAGRVTVEARISHNGQPMPSAGDLQGTSGIIDPAARKPITIRIDRVIS